MTDFQPQGSQPEQTPASPPMGMAATLPTAPARRSRRRLWLIFGLLAAGLCLCVVIAAVTLGAGMLKVARERPRVETVVGQFLSAMAEKDARGAYALFSSRSKRSTSLADLEKLVAGNNYVLFEGYRGVVITNLNLSAVVDSDPDNPRGTVAKAEGIIQYESGFTGTVSASLEQEGDEWRLFAISIRVPPDKLSP